MSFSNYLTPEELRALLLEDAADPSGHPQAPLSPVLDGRDAWIALARRVDKLEDEVARLKDILKTLHQTAAAESNQPPGQQLEEQPEFDADPGDQATPEPLTHEDTAPASEESNEQVAAQALQAEDPESMTMTREEPVEETTETACFASDSSESHPTSLSSAQPQPDSSLLTVRVNDLEYVEAGQAVATELDQLSEAKQTIAMEPDQSTEAEQIIATEADQLTEAEQAIATELEDPPSTPGHDEMTGQAESRIVPPHFRYDGELSPRSMRHPKP
ncbi:hypothetical protein, partial [Paenibacillus xanthanilyticus]